MNSLLLLLLFVCYAIYVAGQSCGNGVIEGNEECDDANQVSEDGCSSTCTVEQDCYDKGNKFSFVVVSDSYTGQDGGVRRMLKDVFNKTRWPNRLMPRAAFISGDWTHFGATDNIINNQLGSNPPHQCSHQSLALPYFVAAGNHDAEEVAGLSWIRDIIGPRVEKQWVGVRNFKEGPVDTTGIKGSDANSTYSFDYKNTHFVVLNQYHGDKSTANANLGCIRQDLMTWLAADLAATTQTFKFIVGHEPAWSFCSSRPGYGSCINYGNNLREDYIDMPSGRARTGVEDNAGYGNHWGDSLEDRKCPKIGGKESRDEFWALISQHKVTAHLIGHTHTYSTRLVEADGKRNRDANGDVLPQAEIQRRAYGKKGVTYSTDDGTWEFDAGSVYTRRAMYILVTIDNDKVLVNSFDYFADDMQEQFSPIEDFIIDAACANTSQGCPTQPPIATPPPSTATTTTTPAPLPTTGVSSTTSPLATPPSTLESAPADTLYVDATPGTDCANYVVASRSCGSSTGVRSFTTIAKAAALATVGKHVVVRAGTYAEAIVPQHNGTSASPVVFRVYDGETATLTGKYVDATAFGDRDGWHFIIYMWERNYITIDGFRSPSIAHTWARIVHSHHIRLTNNYFEKAGATGIQGGILLIDTHDSEIAHNVIVDGNDNLVLLGSDRNSIHHNEIRKGRHSVLALKCSSYNHVHHNQMSNEIQKVMEMYDCGGSSEQRFAGLVGDKPCEFNVVEDNVFGVTPVDDGDGPYNHIQFAPQRSIVRRNVFFDSHGASIGVTNYSPEALRCVENRIYHNTFVDNFGGAFVTSSFSVSNADNHIVNNAMYDNTAMNHRWQDNKRGGSALSHRAMSGIQLRGNSILAKEGEGDTSLILATYDKRVSLSQAKSQHANVYEASNKELTSPGFVDQAGRKFGLTAGSKLIDEGVALTTVDGAASSGNTLTVVDSLYFTTGDYVQCHSKTTTARIVSIQRSTHTLTLDVPLACVAGDGVSLPFTGTLPDIGAFEFGATATTASTATTQTPNANAPATTTESNMSATTESNIATTTEFNMATTTQVNVPTTTGVYACTHGSSGCACDESGACGAALRCGQVELYGARCLPTDEMPADCLIGSAGCKCAPDNLCFPPLICAVAGENKICVTLPETPTPPIVVSAASQRSSLVVSSLMFVAAFAILA